MRPWFGYARVVLGVVVVVVVILLVGHILSADTAGLEHTLGAN